MILAVLAGACGAGCKPRSACKSVNDGQIPATPPDPPLVCPVTIPNDPTNEQRAACAFGAGATVAQTLGISSALARSIPVQHVIVLMQENRSFDHLLGKLHDQGQPDVEAVPASFQNLDTQGVAVYPFHAGTTCLTGDPDHQWSGMHTAVDDGAMDGFVRNAAATTDTDGHFVMSSYDRGDLPFSYWLAAKWALNDRHFASVRSGTFPNRNFLLLGTNDGVQSTGVTFPDEGTPTIFDALQSAGFTWGVYSDGSPLSATLNWDKDHAGSYCLGDFFDRLDTGTLPNVAFVDGVAGVDDDHPPADVQRGEAFVWNLYQHALASPQWSRLAILWTFDECGGFADHVPPPANACVARPIAKDAPYFELGPRTPLVVISPYAKPHFVSHQIVEHTAITRFIETVFDLPALTARDANSPALLDLFDFSCTPPMLSPPTAVQAGTGGCAP